jgi:hypothetical protein
MTVKGQTLLPESKKALARLGRWWLSPLPLGRVAALRTLVYLFVPADLLLTTSWVIPHKDVPGVLYQPLLAGRLLPLPTPDQKLVLGLLAALLVTSLAAATGRAPRLLGTAVFILYFEWMIVAMSYGKVDHDRFGFLVALAVLPTVGQARWGDSRLSERAGWALRATQVAVIATYFLASWAKLRFGGIEWLTGATLTRAVLRRGTIFSDWTTQVPGLLVGWQFFIVAFELFSPMVFLVPERWRRRLIGGFYAFHAMTFAAITISFLPHCVAMAAFLPLENVRPVEWLRGRRHISRRQDPIQPPNDHGRFGETARTGPPLAP